jgi:hypothetical protein
MPNWINAKKNTATYLYFVGKIRAIALEKY